MDIEEFVKDVLAQITGAVNDNKSGGKTSYHVDTTQGVSFDLAVTTGNKSTEEKGVAGGLKVKVIGAEASKAKTDEQSTEKTSRVQFKVNVWTESDEVAGRSSYFPE